MQRLVIGIALGAGVYAIGSAWLGVHGVLTALSAFAGWTLVPVLGLTLMNYALRFFRWTLYLRALGVPVSWQRSLVIFVSGFSMAVSPGKIGELLKAYLLMTSEGLPMSRTAAAVLAERVTDLIALVLLVSVGMVAFRVGLLPVALVAAAVVLFVLVISSRRLSCGLLNLAARLPGLRRRRETLQQLHESTALLFRLPLLGLASLIGTAAWFCECVGTFLIVKGLAIDGVSLLLATFVYGSSTLGGLPTPGGLGLTDGGMAAMLHYFGGVAPAAAGAATMLVRLCTLWFAVAIGVAALMSFRRSLGLNPQFEEAR